MIKCVKTGCYVRVVGYNSGFIGDAYRQGELVVFRLAGRLPQDHPAHVSPDYRIKEITALFDMDGVSESRNATLIAHAANVKNLAQG